MSDMPLPRVWVLESPHAGDNTQLLALAKALGWPFEVKKLAYLPGQTLARLTLGASLLGVNRAASSPLSPPWPDLVLGCGRPTEAVAFWLKRRNPALKLVYLGTPWADLARFDCVITTPQYRLPELPNVVHNALPLHDVGRSAPETDGSVAARLAGLPRPFTAVLVGGRSGPYGFDAGAGARLGAAASAAAGEGALLVTTSKRTPPATAAALAAAITAPADIHRWSPGADNPYRAYLACADRFIVTADSISMIAEALATGKPVAIFDTEQGRRAMRAEEHLPPAPDGSLPPPHWLGASINATAFRLLMRGPAWWSRDLRIVHRRLLADGLVHWLGDLEPQRRGQAGTDDLARALAAVRALFAGHA